MRRTPSRSTCALVAVALLATGCLATTRADGSGPRTAPPSVPSGLEDGRGPITVAAVGDIACDPFDDDFNGGQGSETRCRHADVARAVAAAGPDAVLPLGDIQYEDGDYDKFLVSYAPSWRRFLSFTFPVPGNHEYRGGAADGYFRFFGPRAGPEGLGYYSFDLGRWHLIALNSNCGAVGGCDAGSPQHRWLADDLEANGRPCTLAYWHHPRFSSGPHGDDEGVGPFWRLLYAAGAEIVLAGHDHDYERFHPMTPSGVRNRRTGIRSFVVGTGGKQHYQISSVRKNSAVHDDESYGALTLTLLPGRYAWRFVPAAGASFTDRGSARCHGRP